MIRRDRFGISDEQILSRVHVQPVRTADPGGNFPNWILVVTVLREDQHLIAGSNVDKRARIFPRVQPTVWLWTEIGLAQYRRRWFWHRVRTQQRWLRRG